MRRMMLMAFWLTGLLGCAIQYRYVSTSQTPEQAKPPNCDFAVLAAMPSDGQYQEIGIVEPLDRRPTDRVDQFKQLIRESVCQAGGDAVVGEINRGCYVRGIVLHKVPAN